MEPKSQTKNTKHKRNTKDKTVNEKKWTPIYKTHKKWDLANQGLRDLGIWRFRYFWFWGLRDCKINGKKEEKNIKFQSQLSYGRNQSGCEKAKNLGF